MFLNRRNILAYILLLFAAISFIFGRQYLSSESDSASTSGTTTSVSHVNESTKNPLPFTQEEQNQEEQNPTLGYFLCIISAAYVIIGVFVLRQTIFFLGPDLVSVFFAIYSWQISIPLLKITFFQILLTWIILLSIREIFGWICSKCKISWCFIYRMAKRQKKTQISLSIFMVWCIGILAVTTYFLIGRLTELSIVPLIFVFFSLFFTMLGLWKYGSEIEHFKNQLVRFGKGLEIFIQDEAFSEAEKQLVTIQKEHEEAIRTAVTSERFKVELISNVSHDLRTPLTSILGYSELLQKEPLSEEGKKQLIKLHQKAGYMNELVESLFELTKVSSGALECKKEKIDIICLLEQTIGLLDDELNAAGLTVRRNYKTESLDVFTDGERMHSVFANLLGNAIKYALSGTRIHLEIDQKEENIIIRMVNTASYEMDFDTDEILERFARGDRARSTKGSGLGLTIAKTYTESVGGRFYIRVDGDQFNAVVELPKN